MKSLEKQLDTTCIGIAKMNLNVPKYTKAIRSYEENKVQEEKDGGRRWKACGSMVVKGRTLAQVVGEEWPRIPMKWQEKHQHVNHPPKYMC